MPPSTLTPAQVSHKKCGNAETVTPTPTTTRLFVCCVDIYRYLHISTPIYTWISTRNVETLTLTTRHLSALCAELGTGAVYISNFSQAGVRTTFIFTNNILIEEFATLIVHSNLNCCSFADLGSADAALYLVK